MLRFCTSAPVKSAGPMLCDSSSSSTSLEHVMFRGQAQSVGAGGCLLWSCSGLHGGLRLHGGLPGPAARGHRGLSCLVFPAYEFSVALEDLFYEY